ncbi:uric acid degradation bifunctional protein TTL-like [Arachis stenosperma]|uniref:uric acid degradation bifunctional protein TTL-like n=1 Tax=Arachis stenosperma TaxID=217475 RepID=UPI0025AC3FBA|nr:uric acid degradation bifunctional protein TTL-like [Arachis stenosperma]
MNIVTLWKLEENDLFVCASSFFFIHSIQEASPFSSLDHATAFARDLWFNKSPIRSWLDAFSAHRHIGEAISRAPNELISELNQFGAKYRKKFGFEFLTTTNRGHSYKILEEVKARCDNNLIVELDIASREEFILIERGLTKLWERLSQEKIQEDTDETGEVVQDSMEAEVGHSNSSDEVVSTGPTAAMINYDLNKTPEENESIGVHV